MKSTAAMNEYIPAASWIGTVGYREAYLIQRKIHQSLIESGGPDRLLLLEHPAVITVPRRSHPDNLLVETQTLVKNGIALVRTDRGGEVTLHSPGQLVGYLIVRLQPGKRDLHGYLRWIEEGLTEVVARYGVSGGAKKGLTGLWVEERKIASIGIAVKRWVTLHGFALNVNNDLSLFNHIHPCGLAGVEMTSVEKESGSREDLESVARTTAEIFAFDFVKWKRTESEPAATETERSPT